MRLTRKTLAFGGGEERADGIERPHQFKKLAYAFSLAVPLIAACGAHAAASGGGGAATTMQQPRQRPATPQKRRPACAADVETVLREGERVVGTACRFGSEFVLTNTSLLIIRRAQEERTLEPISLRMRVTRTDMADLIAHGIADWEPSEDSVFVLTRGDKMLTRIPNENMGDTIPAYEMPFETAVLGSDSMVYYSGFLFIAPQNENVMVFSFSGDDTRQGRLNLSSALPDAGFFMREGKLIFGKSGVEETEIRVNGPEIKNIQLIKRML